MRLWKSGTPPQAIGALCLLLSLNFQSNIHPPRGAIFRTFQDPSCNGVREIATYLQYPPGHLRGGSANTTWSRANLKKTYLERSAGLLHVIKCHQKLMETQPYLPEKMFLLERWSFQRTRGICGFPTVVCFFLQGRRLIQSFLRPKEETSTDFLRSNFIIRDLIHSHDHLEMNL